jgi:hypothetical protein
MKHALKTIAIAGALAAGSLFVAAPAAAHDRNSRVGIYVDLGNVSIAYSNGYYDHDRRWHRWRSRAEWAHFRRYHRGLYRDYAYNHDRGRHRGWRRG